VLFIWIATLLISLATGWNVVLYRDYQQMLAVTRSQPAWFSHVLGTLGFGAALGTIVLFFLKILKEMRLNQQQSEFLEIVSHELKTPIASIELSSSLLRAGGLSSDEVERLWGSHQTELKRLREEVEDLLEAARIQSRPTLVKRSPVRLEDWIVHSLDRWTRILGPGASLKREGDPLEGRAEIDLKALNLITDNLVDNARKFSRGRPDLVVRTRRLPPAGIFRKPRWLIEFSDRGWGFDPADSRRIFGRFFRARTSAPQSIPGSGLGLHLADNASRALGIKLRGESSGKGQGASFFIEGKELP
jgi:signal transduction histidine kinase